MNANNEQCDCGKGEWCPQYGEAFAASADRALARAVQPAFHTDNRNFSTTLVAEASSLGLRAGQWPDTIIVAGTVGTFRRTNSGNNQMVIYTNGRGDALHIFND